VNRAPEARWCHEHGVIVHRTHDVDLARQLGLDFLRTNPWAEGWCWELPDPVRTWIRTMPHRPGGEHVYSYAPAEPGERGAFRAVEFPLDGWHIGTRDEEEAA
jgi:hypothetical protein